MTIHSLLIQKILTTNAHLGRHTATHHFKIYTAGSRNGCAIIDSDKTLISMRNAFSFISNLIRHNAKFIFINNNPLCDEIVDQMCHKIGHSNNSQHKLGGFLTNSSSPRKFRSRNKKINFGLVSPPDCMVILDTTRKSSVLLEAERLQIPVVALVDSSMPWEDFKRITYPIPANDSVQFVYLFCNLLTKTFLFEKRRLGSDAAGEKAPALKDEKREEVQPIEKGKIDSGNDEVPGVPSESSAVTSEDLQENVGTS